MNIAKPIVSILAVFAAVKAEQPGKTDVAPQFAKIESSPFARQFGQDSLAHARRISNSIAGNLLEVWIEKDASMKIRTCEVNQFTWGSSQTLNLPPDWEPISMWGCPKMPAKIYAKRCEAWRRAVEVLDKSALLSTAEDCKNYQFAFVNKSGDSDV